MKSRRLLTTLVLGVSLTIALLWLLSSPGTELPAVRAADLHVCPSGCAYSSIQAAVDAASDGDVIKVATGIYTGVSARAGVTQVVYISKSVAIRGGYTTAFTEPPNPEANPTTLDAQEQGRVLYITGNISPTVAGLRITGGDAKGLGGYDDAWSGTGDAGGGMYIIDAAAIISNNWVFSNTASNGGGLFLRWSDATLSGNTVSYNTAYGGGGLYLFGSDDTFSGNTVFSNTAHLGGGLYLGWFSEATLSGNTIFSNNANNGGGLCLWYGSHSTFRGNTIVTNTAEYGGGLYLEGSDPTLSGNTVSSNTAGQDGGGLYLWDSYAVLDNNFVTNNSSSSGNGSGLYVHASSPQLRHNTIARNHGGGGEGLYVTGTDEPSQPQLYNTILVSHGVGIQVDGNSSAQLEGTLWGSGEWANIIDWSGNVTNTVNVWGDPDFVDYATRDYHITAGSAAVDAGVYVFLEDDVDGDPRPMAFGPDIGADERLGPGLGLHKWSPLPFSQDARNPGQTITYTLVVTGVNTGLVSNVILMDALPPEQRVITSAASVGDCAIAATPVWGGGITCALGTLNAGDSARITLTAQVTTALPSTLPRRMRNRAWVTGTQASNFAYTDVYLQDCHVRLNDGPSEWGDIQTVVDVSTRPTDVVKVAGVCAGINSRGDTRQVVYISKTVTIRGGYGYSPTNWTTSDPVANPTTLNARRQGRVLYITGDITPTVEGLRITGGDASGLGGYTHPLWEPVDAGGGMYIVDAAAMISNNWVFSNTASYGGGLLLRYSGATLSGNTVSYNTAYYSGGGLYLWCDGDAMLSGNTVYSNTADVGGGLYLDFSAATLINNVVADNQTDGAGSGLYISASSPRLMYTTIARNSGGDGSGLYVTSGYLHPWAYYSTVALTNTILVSHTVGITVTDGNTATLDGVLWYSNTTDYGGEGTITVTQAYTGNPAFAADGYHLMPFSEAIDKGVDAGVTTDIDGFRRPCGLAPDLGADEINCLYLPAIFKNSN